MTGTIKLGLESDSSLITTILPRIVSTYRLPITAGT